MIGQDAQHRNKCQNCFRKIGKYILDCYCYLCDDCFRQSNRNTPRCLICHKPTSGRFIDTRDRESMGKVNHLFGNFESTLTRCIDIYRFQSEIDLRYCRYLQTQLSKYKELLTNIINENPRLTEYVNHFFRAKATPHQSVSEDPRPNHKQERSPNTSRSDTGKPVAQVYQEQLMGEKKNQTNKNYSAKLNYRVPNLNYNTALRSSKRARRDFEENEIFYYRRK